ncbi:hypothetical protein HMPREF0373_00251 [Eubacterium ramulus ATCC 29099]|uniref:Uncharacterized protein n=1 Tax=Eubacterium ramulus ATCC 29099 TaxID=1256908 RepID=U2Q6N5_EUBRA|nr:hypothetical protein HMPREF0373_00251 [Eubacterium ramulus ATCC 29099]
MASISVIKYERSAYMSAYADQNVQECPRHSCCEMHTYNLNAQLT